MRHISIAAAFEQWAEVFKPAIPAGDGPAHAESWNDFTDSLCKDGSFNNLQYHHCPAWDDEMPDDDAEFLLDRLGVSLAPMPGGVAIKRGENGIVYPMPEGETRGASDADLFEAVLLEVDASELFAPLLRIFSASELADLREVFDER